jgi:Lar family restriction alleviation protein
MTTKLTATKPCPFCGSSTKSFKRIDRDAEQSLYLYWVDCANRECGVQFPLGERTEEKAIEKWNKRYEPQTDCIRCLGNGMIAEGDGYSQCPKCLGVGKV